MKISPTSIGNKLTGPKQINYTNRWQTRGEGIAIGLDAMKRVDIMGTKTAGLPGEIYTFETPETKIPFSFPCVQLQHVNGQPREDFAPSVVISNNKEAISTAVEVLHKKIKKTSASSKLSTSKHWCSKAFMTLINIANIFETTLREGSLHWLCYLSNNTTISLSRCVAVL